MSFLGKMLQRRRSPPLDLTHPQTIALSKRLRALHAMPIATEEERKAWDAVAAKLEEAMHVEYKEIYDSLSHEITHYLVDVDIRAKDPGYAKYQEGLLADLLTPASPEPVGGSNLRPSLSGAVEINRGKI